MLPQFGNLNYLHLGWLILLGVIVTGMTWHQRRRARRKFATPELVQRFVSRGSKWSNLGSAILLPLILILMALALVDIRWGKTNRTVPQKGIEVMFVLDISRSMLAEDVTPNRLGRAKQLIIDMLDEMSGDRAGLVVFAGDARQRIPLTSHYADFKQTLQEVDPFDLRRGGSRLGDAIRLASDAFLTKTLDHKAMIVLTDGEDQESKPIEAAQTAYAKQGIRIFTIGLGDMEQGAPIPASDRSTLAESNSGDEFLTHHGETVITKLDGSTLEAIALESEGAYIPAGTRRVDMADVYHGYISRIEEKEFESAEINSYVPRFHWFLVPAFILMLVETSIATMRRKKSGRFSLNAVRRATAPSDSSRKVGSRAAAALLAVVLTGHGLASEAYAQKVPTPDSASDLLQSGQLELALEQFEQLSGESDSPEFRYNHAVALYRSGNIDAAREKFEQVAASAATELAARAQYNLGNCLYAQAVKQAQHQPESAITQLESAIQHYRDSLRNNPHDTDARANIELAQRLIDQLRQKEQDQQQEQSQSDPEDNQQQDQNQQENQQDQQQDSNQDSQGERESQQNDDQRQTDDQESADQQNQQRESDSKDDAQEGDTTHSEQNQNESESEDQSDSQQENRDQQQGEQRSAQKREQQSGQESEQQPNQQSANQEDADPQQMSNQNRTSDRPLDSNSEERFDPPSEPETPELSEEGDQEPIQGKLESAGEADDETGQRAVAIEPTGGAEEMPQQEAMKMLQSVRDREMLRRLRMERLQRSRRIPVDRDW